MINVLVTCEESQEVCKALRSRGANAYSCDIVECSGGHPEWHIMEDVIPLLDGYCSFRTTDGEIHAIKGKRDMIIGFPPCTHLAVSGARHFEKKRADGRQREAIKLFCNFFYADCEHIAIENPVNIISGNYITKWFPDLAERYQLPRKASCSIQPYDFGHNVRKKTNLWLKNLPALLPTNTVEPELVSYVKKDGSVTTFSKSYCIGSESHESAFRSKTFHGVAEAMADQWLAYLKEN